MTRKTKKTDRKSIKVLTHEKAKRKHIPTIEHQPAMRQDEQAPIRAAYERRNRDLDPQLVWRGKDEQDLSDLVTQAPPLYIQEKVHPKVLIDNLPRRSQVAAPAEEEQPDLFADFNGLSAGARTEFYQHDANWTNRMILGDSLQVMASLIEREGLGGKVQCIYLDPPYGIKFNSNFQWSTTSRNVKDGNLKHITREPEQVKAFRDTWRDRVHSYLTHLRDRLTVARDLLTESGSIFVQIGNENVHRVRMLLDEVFGSDNYQNTIYFTTTGGLATSGLSRVGDYVIWYAKNSSCIKYRQLFVAKKGADAVGSAYKNIETDIGIRRRLSGQEINAASDHAIKGRIFRIDNLSSQDAPKEPTPFSFQGHEYHPTEGRHWTANYPDGMNRLMLADRIYATESRLYYVRFFDDHPVAPLTDVWIDTSHSGFAYKKLYVVQTATTVVERCLLMATNPGDLVLDPTCGSATTAYVAEKWGRRWITIDTSRVALALARARIMGAKYPYYLLADSPEGKRKKAELDRTAVSSQPSCGDIRRGFVYEQVPHITPKAIANNAEIEVIWDRFQQALEPLRTQLNKARGENWEEWNIPREPDEDWSDEVRELHTQWWEQRTARQQEIDKSIAAKAESEDLYDRPYEDKGILRVAGPFTVESLSPHRVLNVDENDEPTGRDVSEMKFLEVILENLRMAGVQQTHKEDKINFISLTPWPGTLICAEGRYIEGATDNAESASGPEKRAAIFIGEEFSTVSRPDLVAATREASDADFDVLISCAFNYDAPSSEFSRLGRIPVLKARINADLHMATELKNTGTGNLFVIFGEPDIDVLNAADGQIQVRINGVTVFRPQTGVHSDDPGEIACWMLDTDYNEESFFVRHAYFPGTKDPYEALQNSLQTEIDEIAWDTLRSSISRPFPRPQSDRIAVKVINHLGDEVMKVFRVSDELSKKTGD